MPLQPLLTMSVLNMKASDDDEKTRNLRDKVYRLKLQVKYLQKRNKEQKQWINKLTNKNHPARRAGK